MGNWNSTQYLLFEKQRTQPATDLASRIRNYNPNNVLDIGCGPGNSSHVLKEIFPDAKVIGIDNSSDMIEKAKQTYSNIEFRRENANEIKGQYDVIFSNACLQWIPNHRQLIPSLMERLEDKGVLAVQIPMNEQEPLFQIIKSITSNSKWGFHNTILEKANTLYPDEYFEILSECSSSFQIWETTYYHTLSNHKAMLDWVKGTRIRPYLEYLESLDMDLARQFEKELFEKIQITYPIMKNGEILLRFNRFFFVAVQ